MFVREADEAVRIYSAGRDAYLDYDVLERAPRGAAARSSAQRRPAATPAVIRGGMTNKAFLAGLLEHPDLVTGRFDTGWLERLMRKDRHLPPGQRAVAALISAAIDAYDSNREIERKRFFLSAVGGRPQTIWNSFTGSTCCSAERLTPSRCTRSGPAGTGCWSMATGSTPTRNEPGRSNGVWSPPGVPFRVASVRQDTETLVEVDGRPHRITVDDGGLVRAPSPGVLVDIAVRAGDEVATGDRLATLESMKMEVALRAPADGWVREVLAMVGAPVGIGSPLFRLETEPQGTVPAGAADRADFSALVTSDSGDPCISVARALGELRSQVLGNDYSDGEARRIVAVYRQHRSELAPGDARHPHRGQRGAGAGTP